MIHVWEDGEAVYIVAIKDDLEIKVSVVPKISENVSEKHSIE